MDDSKVKRRSTRFEKLSGVRMFNNAVKTDALNVLIVNKMSARLLENRVAFIMKEMYASTLLAL